MHSAEACDGELARHVYEFRLGNLSRVSVGRNPVEHELDQHNWRRVASRGLGKGRGPI